MERTSARWECVEEKTGGGCSKYFHKFRCEGEREQVAGGGVRSKEDLFIYSYDRATRACLSADGYARVRQQNPEAWL